MQAFEIMNVSSFAIPNLDAICSPIEPNIIRESDLMLSASV